MPGSKDELIEQIVKEYTNKIEDTVLRRLLEKAKLMSDTLDSDYTQSLNNLAKIHKAQSDWIKNQNDLIKTLDAEIIANKERLAKAKRETERNYQQETEYRNEIERLEKERTDRKNSLLIREMQNSGAMSDADKAYADKLYGQWKSGKITQEQYEMKMGARYGEDYDKEAARKFEEYRQKQLGRADTVINIAEGSGMTGLSGVADMGISALSKAGPSGAIAAAVLKVVKAGIENILSRMDAAYKMLAHSIDEGNQIMLDNKAAIDTRLQGLEGQFGDSGSTFKDMVKTVMHDTSQSAVINQKAYVENISKLVESGVAYNVEERALMMTLSDKIATTFEALDKSLTRLIRIQQADMTASALGREASLTKFLNQQFGDTSYMSDLYDNTSATLLEAASQMNIDQADSFIYSVQKWLGSLYALGMSQEAVGTIAQGLSYISTGNINALNSNQGMQTLFAMATENAGMSYSSMLTQGLDAEMVDTLMLSMVNYLGEIAKNTSNQVVKSQWADILNMTVSDLRAVSNLTEADMAALSAQSNLGYGEAKGYLYDVTTSSAFWDRYSTQELIKNVIENVLFEAGMGGTAMNDEEAMQYILQGYAEQLMGKGTIVEKFGVFLQNMTRLSDSGLIKNMDEVYQMIRSVVLGQEGTAGYADMALDWYNSLDPVNDAQLIAALRAGGAVSQWTNASPTVRRNNLQYQQNVIKDLLASSLVNSYNNGRGSDFTGLTTAGVGSIGDLIWAMSDNTPFRTSVSRSATVYTSAADSITKGFDAVESSANVISSASEETTDQMEKLYNMLFESQSVPIKVFIEGYSDDFKENSEELLGKINDELADRLEIALNNSSNSVYSMISTIQGLKGV